jgi:hypothetical protein
MASYTYAELKDNLQAMVDDDSSELQDSLDNIIALGELRLLRDLPLAIFDKIETLAFTPGSTTLTKPAGTVATRNMFFINGAGVLTHLEPRDLAYCYDYGPSPATTTPSPRFYADQDEDSWYIAGTPSAASVVKARLTIRPEGLSSTNTATWLSTNVGDLLLMACLVETEAFIKADERIAVWKTNNGERLGAARREMKDSIAIDYWPVGKNAQ